MQLIYKLIEDVAPPTPLCSSRGRAGRQGTGRPGNSPAQPPPEKPFCVDQLLGLSQHAARKRALRPREGGFPPGHRGAALAA